MKYAQRIIFCFFMISITQLLCAEGFCAGTLVKTAAAYQLIESVQSGDDVWAYNFDAKKYVTKQICSVTKTSVDRICTVHLGNICIICAPDQLFFCINANSWVHASELNSGDELLCGQNKKCLVNFVECIDQQSDVYQISVSDVHNFSVSQNDVCAHNFFPTIVLGFSWIIGGGLSFSAAIGVAGVAVGIMACKKRKNKYKNQIKAFVAPTSFASVGSPDDPDKKRKNPIRVNNMQEFFQTDFGSDIKPNLEKNTYYSARTVSVSGEKRYAAI